MIHEKVAEVFESDESAMGMIGQNLPIPLTPLVLPRPGLCAAHHRNEGQ